MDAPRSPSKEQSFAKYWEAVSMARPLATAKPQLNGVNGNLHAWTAADEPPAAPAEPSDTWESDEAAPSNSDGEGVGPQDVQASLAHAGPESPPFDEVELERLRTENAQLRVTVTEYENLLDEKSEVIRELHQRIKELHDRPAAETPREEDLLGLSEELDCERRQLKDDEEALMKQMRDMEVQMSRERAEFARQRNELQRLQSEIRHELELAARDAGLRERLAPLQRRHQEMMNRRGGAPTGPPVQGPAASPRVQEPPPPKKDSGLIRRLFG